mmetsp:Transcript_18477/g.51756  ORF Transcript_18477/g.51756 Transcript_18477/m.51756 type:complete len:90 (-) Transcript_18477:1093-1362(-)
MGTRLTQLLTSTSPELLGHAAAPWLTIAAKTERRPLQGSLLQEARMGGLESGTNWKINKTETSTEKENSLLVEWLEAVFNSQPAQQRIS